MTPTTAELSITATPGSTVFYVESKTPLTEPEEVFAAADVQQITVEDTGAGTLSLKDLEQGTTYYYYFASQLGSKTSQVVAVEVCPAALSLENAEVILTGAVQGNAGEITKSVPGFELQHYGERVYNGEAMPFTASRIPLRTRWSRT